MTGHPPSEAPRPTFEAHFEPELPEVIWDRKFGPSGVISPRGPRGTLGLESGIDSSGLDRPNRRV